MKNKLKTLSILLLLISILLTGCESLTAQNIADEFDSSYFNSIEIGTNEIETNEFGTNEFNQESQTNLNELDNVGATITIFNTNDTLYLPSSYNGNPYVVLNNNVPFFTNNEITLNEFEEYSPLDSLGRCGVAFCNVSQLTMPTEERGNIGSVKPSGWHSVKYMDVGIDGNYLFNRCHLIGFQLAGENANEQNLITGTRYLNIDGMLDLENEIAEYVKSTNNHVLYRVTPIYENDNLLANGVLMEALSVEDNGKGLSACIFAYNVQPNIAIDYKTGESCLSTDTLVVNKTSNESIVTNDGVSTSSIRLEPQNYIINRNSHKFHNPTCSGAESMKESNKETYNGTREWLIENGYEPCGICNP